MKYLIIILSLIFISCSNKEIKTLEQNQVEMRDCILYENGERKPFTGKVVLKYKTGQIEREINYKNGERNGLSKYYYPTGQIESETIFKKGIIKSGRDYKENGDLESSYSGDNVFVETFSTVLLKLLL